MSVSLAKPAACTHETRIAAPANGAFDGVASVWLCEDCGDERPFTERDYAWTAQPWSPPFIPGEVDSRGYHRFGSMVTRDERFAYWAAQPV